MVSGLVVAQLLVSSILIGRPSPCDPGSSPGAIYMMTGDSSGMVTIPSARIRPPRHVCIAQLVERRAVALRAGRSTEFPKLGLPGSIPGRGTAR